MKKLLFWRLFIVLSFGVVIFFSLLHSVAILSNEKMSYLKKSHQQELLNWGNIAQEYIKNKNFRELDTWINKLSDTENTWVTVVQSDIQVLAGNPLSKRFWDGYGIGRNVKWKIHLDFPNNPIMEIALTPQDHHFLILLPDRMRPGTYMSHAFWLFRVIIPFTALLALTIYLYRYVMRPLQHFHHATREFSKGNLNARIGHYLNLGSDEISQVAKTFDHMAERTSKIIEHNRNLLSDMSHEIRTPIARVEMALDCIGQNIKTDLMLERIKNETQNMRMLAEDTLTLAWIENERPDLRQESFDLTELIDAIIDDASFEYPDRIIDVQSVDHLHLSYSNQRALGQALENILRNGLRYTPEGEALTVNIQKVGKKAQVTFTDSGPGIDSTFYEKIFTPFFKTPTQVGTRKGFGVGLALAKRHIEAVHGTVTAKNSPSRGLSITVLLPS
ncbi:sensor histidine kinase [Vibrio tasmaniensis]|uniref:sensor histidine kinase n=1 Tax=Vibrio tasmaniensis TaxID=212663 RepID=UPI00108007FD|nr:sensor histidine kinase [Vibrio tasmaniensis]